MTHVVSSMSSRPTRIRLLIAACAFMFTGAMAMADQEAFSAYNTTFRKTYWSQLYPNSGFEFYCGERYDAPIAGRTPPGMSLEHAYAAQWMVEALQCGANRVECRARNQRFGFLEADMHNLFPASGPVNSSRGNRLFAEIPGEDHNFEDCDFEQRGNQAEPRPITRGNFARAIFYMHLEYNIPIDATMLPVLIKWDRRDPVNQTERRRNDKIERLQGTRNPFIDDPNQVRETFPEQFE
jgi:deoxyribonuclease I